MSLIDELNDEERAIFAFAKQHLKAEGFVWELDENVDLSDVREIIDHYRWLQ